MTLSISAPEDLEELVNRITNEEFQRDERIPYWADIWHSAVALGLFINRNPLLVAGRKVLELGCGLGVCGVVAALRGAEVSFSDYDEHALRFAELNLLANAPDSTAEFLLLDFREPPERKWECLIAADVIYEERFIEPLLGCIDAALAENGFLLLAHPNREVSETLVSRLPGLGFQSSSFALPASYNSHIVNATIEVVTRRGSFVEGLDVTSIAPEIH